MPQSRKPKRAVRRAPATRTPARPKAAPVLSLPPALADSAQPLPPEPVVEPKRGVATLPKNSVVRQKALAIMAMRLAGHANDAIAAELGLSEKSLNQYLWMAGKRGWIPRKKGFADPKDDMEFSLAHKVVRNLDSLLDSEDNETKKEVTLEVAKGTLFKRFGEQAVVAPPSTVLAIRIEMPPGPTQEIREGTTGGRGRWIEATIVDDPAT